jgi:hypothetical protein
MVRRAYVLRVGSSNYAAVGENKSGVYVYFDNSFNWLIGFASMQ